MVDISRVFGFSFATVIRGLVDTFAMPAVEWICDGKWNSKPDNSIKTWFSNHGFRLFVIPVFCGL